MLRFEKKGNGSYKTERYETIKPSEAVEMLAGFEEVYTLDEKDNLVKFDLFDNFKDKSINNFGELLNLKFYKKVEINLSQKSKMKFTC